MDDADRMVLYLVTITAGGVLGITFASSFTLLSRFLLIWLLGSLAIISVYDLLPRIGSRPKYPATSSIEQVAALSEANRVAELLSRLRSLRGKIGEVAYERLEEEYLRRLRDSLEKETRSEVEHRNQPK